MEKTALQYVRRLEKELERLTDGPRVFSQRDWRLATRWHELGIPVGLVLDTLQEASFGVSGLSKIARKVESSWEAVRKGRRSATAPETGTTEPVGWEEGLQQVLESVVECEDVRNLILQLLEKGRAGVSPDQLEVILAERLPMVASQDIFEASRLEAENSLAAQRHRMPPGVFKKTLNAGILTRLRRYYGISRIRE